MFLFRISERRIRLILGDHDRRHDDQDQQTLTIEKVFIRQDFVKKTFNNDIALIKLNRDVGINNNNNRQGSRFLSGPVLPLHTTSVPSHHRP